MVEVCLLFAELVWFHGSIISLNIQTRKILNTFLNQRQPPLTQSPWNSFLQGTPPSYQVELFNLIGISHTIWETMNGIDLLVLQEGSAHPDSQILIC